MSDSDDEAYVGPATGRKSRTNYTKNFMLVLKRQRLRKVPGSTAYVYDSVIDPSRKNELDDRYRERVPNRHFAKGKLQRPALDHEIQYANLDEQYEQAVIRERGKPRSLRRSSIDLAKAFENASADPDNLSIKSHAEHKATGGSLRRGQFPEARRKKAAKLIEKHYRQIASAHTQDESEASLWDKNSPKWAVQKSTSSASSALPRRSKRKKMRRRVVSLVSKPRLKRAASLP